MSMVSLGLICGIVWKPELPNREKIKDKLKQLESIYNVERRAIEYFCYVARSQMFIDGNKRVAQLIANKILIENGIGILQIPNLLVEVFRKLLLEYYETCDMENIYMFMLENCIRGVCSEEN